jgi:hypothetical protein
MNPVHTLPFYCPEIYFNIIITNTPRSSEWSLLFRIFNENALVYHLFNACYMPSQSHPHLFDEEYKLWGSSLCNFFPASCHFIPIRFTYSPKLPVLKHPQSVSFPNARDQVLHPCKIKMMCHGINKQNIKWNFVPCVERSNYWNHASQIFLWLYLLHSVHALTVSSTASASIRIFPEDKFKQESFTFFPPD